MRILVGLLLFIGALFAEDSDLEFLKSMRPTSAKEIAPKAYTENQILNKEHITLDYLKSIAPTDEDSFNLDDSVVYQEIRVTDLLLSTSNVPKQVYQNQVFGIYFSANIQQNINLDLNLTINKSNTLSWLNKDNISWSKDIHGVYSTKLWFESNSTDASIDSIEVVAKRNGEFFQKASIKPKIPKIVSVEERENYAHIVADELIVKNYKTSKFDDESNIMTIELAAKNANLESFWINDPSILRQGLNSTKGTYLNQSGFFFVVFDNSKNKFDFNYFNSTTKQFENFSLGINIEYDDLSKQVDLNPQNNPFSAYKKAVIYLGVIMLLFMYIASKNSTPLIFACFLIAFNIYIQDPHYVGVVKNGTNVKILPIERSTVFYVTQKDENVEIFNKNEGYYKVLFNNGKIGWVRENSISIK
ncbi:MAG: hypothetical protein GXZ15_02765 [Campylobacter sp.]|nr:hypothetical protein [Campylobacter sp.]